MRTVNRLIEKHGLRASGILLALLLLGSGLTVLNSEPTRFEISGEALSIDESKYSKISLNEASAEDLEDLPKIGPVLAQRIIDHRNANGPFASLDDLVMVKGITSTVIEAIRDKVII